MLKESFRMTFNAYLVLFLLDKVVHQAVSH